jgi:hypothetical protein
MPLRWCARELSNFPTSEFKQEAGMWIHRPSDDPEGHPADREPTDPDGPLYGPTLDLERDE